jgi:ABC-type sulfate/molybdate transport systems ATPase subunit
MLEFDILTIQNKRKYHFKSSFQSSKIHSIIGESGSGKSTFLNMLIGKIPIKEGFIKYKERVLFDSSNNININIYNRQISCIYQSLNLFENMSVEENIAYGLKDKTKLQHYIKKYKLEEIAKLNIYNLSGGQKAKCAITRSLVSNYEVLLLDEAFANLDDNSKKIYKKSLINIAKTKNKCIIFISHNLKDVHDISDEVYEIENQTIDKVKNNTSDTLELQSINKDNKDNIYYIKNSFIHIDKPIVFKNNKTNITFKTIIKS